MLRARICGGAPAVRLCANHQPAAVHWRFAREVKNDRTAVGFFFAGASHEPTGIELRPLSPRPGSETRRLCPAQRS